MTSSDPPPTGSAAGSEPQRKSEGARPDSGEIPLGSGIDFRDPDSRLAPYYLHTRHVLTAALLAGVFVLCAWVPLWHTDVWGHLAFGRWIVENRRLPEHEPFSPFADKQAPYAHYQWLTQVGAYLIYRTGETLAGGDAAHRMLGGVELLRAMHAVLSVLLFAVLLVAYRRVSNSLPLALVGALVLLLLMLSSLMVQRPQEVGRLFFACVLLAVSRPILSRIALVAVPVLITLWANMHGSFVVGLGLLGLCLLGRAVEAARTDGGWQLRRLLSDSQVVRLFAVVLLSAVAVALLNPHGPALYLYVLKLGGNANIQTLEEWGPLDFTTGPGGHWGYAATLVLLLVSQALSPRAFTPTQLLILVVFGVAPCLQQRMMVWWLMLVPWLALPHWAALAGRLPESWRQPGEASLTKTLLVVAVAVVLPLLSRVGPLNWLVTLRPRGPVVQAVSAGTPWALAAQLTADPNQPPALPALQEALQKHYPGGRFVGRIFASETQGEYLMWALPPETPVLVYGHVHLFPEEHWQSCLMVKYALPGWWEFLDRSGVNLVVIEAEQHAALAQRLREDSAWVVVLDEAGTSAKQDLRNRLFIALRKQPL